MKILFDYQAFYDQNIGGISRVTNSLVTTLKQNNSHKIFLINFLSFNLYSQKSQLFNNFILHSKIDVNTSFFKIRRYFVRRFTNFKLLFFAPDIFIPTYYDCYFLKSLGTTPMILTVHDMIHEKFNDLFVDSKKIVLNKRKLLYASSSIITPSHNTKNDILAIYPDIPSAKIHVIHWGNDMSKFETSLSRNIKLKQILFVGKRDAYKNFQWLIKSVSNWIISNDYILICVGGGLFSENEIKLLDSFNISNRVFQENLSDKSLANLYTQSFAIIIPSFYEGFCLPLIEAMSCYCPVVYSNSSCLPEIAGNAGVSYFENDSFSLINNLDKLLYDSFFYNKQVDLGISRASHFSWEKCASSLSSIFLKYKKSNSL